MKATMPDPIFIIGCARSGTTWLGQILAQSEGFRVTIEDPEIFSLVDEAVLYWDRQKEVAEHLIARYRAEITLAGASIYVDKSHQNIWLVELIDRALPAARYVAIERTPYATIASMMRHPGVRRHFLHWRSYTLPNHHLGITLADAAGYDMLPLSVKCALRWRSHRERLAELRQALGPRIHVIRYENLVEDTAGELTRLGAFIGRRLRPVPAAAATLEKWRDILSVRQRADIDQIVANVFSAAKSCVVPQVT
jgi:hypothetical protein